MSDSVVVTFASRYGSTREVAEAMAATLRERGLEADARPMREVRTLEGYGAIVLGTGLYMGHWYKDADRFLSQHRAALTGRPVAVFALGPIRSPLDEEERQGSLAQLDERLAKFPWLEPIAREVFGGKYDPAKLRFPDNLIASLPASPLKGMPASDVRDWRAIRAWATALAAKLRPTLTH
ncbi:MAG: flavodoxin domain-containing protein [Dehalococcoidales bacterium]|nr:flavodoxin domain-containing protein [Dehalococcoidales bacterium]